MITAAEALDQFKSSCLVKHHEPAIDKLIREAVTDGRGRVQYDMPGGAAQYSIAEAIAKKYASAGWIAKAYLTKKTSGAFVELELPGEDEDAKHSR
jgi:hypothetical protein